MSRNIYERIDTYIEELFVASDPALQSALERSREGGLPDIQVSPAQGKFLYLLAKLISAERILELGTLGGYSTIWLARALPDHGRLISLEFSDKHAEVARANIEMAGLSSRVEVIVVAALDSLPKLSARGAPFDLIFIDADKTNYPAYLDWCVRLTRPGGLILADNVIRHGEVLAPDEHDANAKGAADFNKALAADPRVEAVLLQLVGAKGHDGLAIVRAR
jgi:predicted O-methyltransferase YrrM